MADVSVTLTVLFDEPFWVGLYERETDGRYRRFEEEHEQRAHSAAELTAWLEAEGFQNVEVFGNQTFDPPGAEEERLHFLARRP